MKSDEREYEEKRRVKHILNVKRTYPLFKCNNGHWRRGEPAGGEEPAEDIYSSAGGEIRCLSCSGEPDHSCLSDGTIFCL